MSTPTCVVCHHRQEDHVTSSDRHSCQVVGCRCQILWTPGSVPQMTETVA